jgi:hypothetical protein
MYRHPGPAAARLTVSAPDQPEPVQEIEVVRWLEQMRADVAETLGGVMLRSARAVALTVLPTILSLSPGRIVGWSLRETAGQPYTVRLRNGDNPAADVVAVITGVAGSGDTKWLGPGGVSFTEGLYVELVAGSVEGAIYLGAAD